MYDVGKLCEYRQLMHIAKEEGNRLDLQYVSNLGGCQELCDVTMGCKSLAYCQEGRACFLYDKQIHGDDPQIVNEDCFTSYQCCDC